jgi:phospholipid/cholesterol/gamma-HCH transport system substrate-binding protein
MNATARRELRDVVVGLCVCAAVIAMLVLVFGPPVLARTSTYDVHATFGRTDGISIGSPVRAAGITVGQVSGLELLDGFRVKATMTIDEDVELDTDASAAIVTDGIFGEKLVRIDIGGGERIIADGGTISFTEDAVVLDDLLSLIISQANARRDAAKTESDQ